MSGSRHRVAWVFIVIVLLPVMLSLWVCYRSANLIPLLVYVLMGVGTFLLYRVDKNRAIQGQWRIPESSLQLCALFGGWSGALFAQQYLRHKNRKVSFQLVFWLIVSVHLLVWGDWLLFKQHFFYALLGNF
jgi:uncharacterized membrane protein YsdA (DUF1294 family)